MHEARPTLYTGTNQNKSGMQVAIRTILVNNTCELQKRRDGDDKKVEESVRHSKENMRRLAANVERMIAALGRAGFLLSRAYKHSAAKSIQFEYIGVHLL